MEASSPRIRERTTAKRADFLLIRGSPTPFMSLNDPTSFEDTDGEKSAGGYHAPVNSENRARTTFSDRVFQRVGERLEQSETGAEVVTHVRQHREWYYQAWSLFATLLVVLFLRFFVITAFYIPSPSMINTLMVDDRVFVNRLAYWFSEPKVGDIVVFKVPESIPDYDPEKPIWIKRVVGVEGNTVSIEDFRLMVDGKSVTDPPFLRHNRYIPRSMHGNTFEPITVPEGSVLVFGDNSGNSYDSRYWGPIPKDRIIGKAFVRFWPLSRIGPLHGESVRPLPNDYLSDRSVQVRRQRT